MIASQARSFVAIGDGGTFPGLRSGFQRSPGMHQFPGRDWSVLTRWSGKVWIEQISSVSGCPGAIAESARATADVIIEFLESLHSDVAKWSPSAPALNGYAPSPD
jgi:hypothetical protein